MMKSPVRMLTGCLGQILVLTPPPQKRKSCGQKINWFYNIAQIAYLFFFFSKKVILRSCPENEHQLCPTRALPASGGRKGGGGGEERRKFHGNNSRRRSRPPLFEATLQKWALLKMLLRAPESNTHTHTHRFLCPPLIKKKITYMYIWVI